MNQPFVTIAIPFYNAETYLAEAIRSVFAQTYKNWELILIDDGSTDGSLAIAQSVSDDRVRVVSDGKNKKLAARLNEITKLAKHDYLVRMDADDIISTTRIEEQMKVLISNPEMDIVTTGVITISDNGEYLGHRGNDAVNISLEDLLTKKVGVTHAAMIGKKCWWERNPYDENLKVAQDYSRWVKSAAKGDFKVMSLKNPLYYYREEGNVTAKKMLTAYSYELKLLHIYTSGISGIKLKLKLISKIVVVKILSKLGMMNILLKKRLNEISETYREEYENQISLISQTKVPGIDPL